MRLNLTSQISLNQVSLKYYKPKNDVERAALTRFEKIRTDISETMERASQQVAEELIYAIRLKQEKHENFVLALTGGTSLSELLKILVKKHVEEGVSFRNVIVFNAYEYYPLPKDAASSNLQFLKDNFLDKVDILPENVYSPDATIPKDDVLEYCSTYESSLNAVGGLDVTVMGIGQDGNIAVNEGGSQLSSRTRLMLLGNTSRAEASKIFGSQDGVPDCAITMGVGTLLSAKKVYMLAWGEEKADIVAKAVEGQMADVLPASFLQFHPDATVVLDLAAAAHLTRIRHPWLVTSCEWNSKLIRSAIVWLCGLINKPILKLTNRDYNEHGLSELLALYGSAYDVNIRIFNDLQHTITGWPGGKPNADDTYRPERATPFPKRVIVFSPHPDDDVISMGGTLQRLIKQGHDVHVAYETSGNIAVSDEEVNRFLHFLKGFNEIFDGSKDEVINHKYAEIKAFLQKKQSSADLDTRDILTIKGLIRRGEARIAGYYNHLTDDHIHFLDLPFYETGKVVKNPLGEPDVKIVQKFLHEVKPHQIFVAGDLADPHGTHRVCTNAVFAAIDEEKKAGAKWLEDCRIWMYRGAWAEWEIENIEMVVPMSPEELRNKRNAILKHQSQMEGAPYLGDDERLFWQRSEDRNHATAKLYQDLGLASYEAMEAFVEYKQL